MLHELTIENFALLAHVHIRFGAGLNVLTGETGAGKSIIIDAISRVLGSRGGADDVRTGATHAHIEAVFSLAEPPAALHTLLAERGLLATDDGEQATDSGPLDLILTRDIRPNGRSVGRVNGRAVPLHTLAALGRFLLDIHGQTEHLSLLQPATQLQLLDRFGGLAALATEVRTTAAALGNARRQWRALQQDERELARRVDLLRYQIDEITNADVQPGEDGALQQERHLLLNAEQLASATASAYAQLTGSAGAAGALDQLGDAARQLNALTAIDPSLAETAALLTEATALVEEVGRSLRAYAEAVESDPARLAEVEERLDLIRSLQRKYGDTIEAVLDYGAAAAAELDGLTRRDERLAELAAQAEDLAAQLGRHATRLSRARRQAARQLAAAVADELADLNLSAAFEVAVECQPAPDGIPWSPDEAPALGEEPAPSTLLAWDDSGMDTVEFRIAPNPGEPLKPVARIASGGEMSRILLALKSILSGVDRTPTLIFDEIDVGIGGRSGRVLGEKLAELAAQHQVLCVTHLPQLAVYGRSHFFIAKEEQQHRTTTTVQELAGQERLSEIAQMLGGATAASLNRAREMLERANRRSAAA